MDSKERYLDAHTSVAALLLARTPGIFARIINALSFNVMGNALRSSRRTPGRPQEESSGRGRDMRREIRPGTRLGSEVKEKRELGERE